MVPEDIFVFHLEKMDEAVLQRQVGFHLTGEPDWLINHYCVALLFSPDGELLN